PLLRLSSLLIEWSITYVWPSSFSLPICLYYIVRYLPMPWAAVTIHHLAKHMSTSFCRGYLAGQLLAQAFTYIPATWLLSIRVLALYPPNPKLRYLVYGSLVLTHIAVLSVGSYSFTGIWHSLRWSRLLHDCGGDPPRLLGVALILLIPFETLLVGLQLYHNFLHRRMLHAAKSDGCPSVSRDSKVTPRPTTTSETRSMTRPRNSDIAHSDVKLLKDEPESILMTPMSKVEGGFKGKERCPCPIAAMKRRFAREEGLSGGPSFSFTRLDSRTSRATLETFNASPPSPPPQIPPLAFLPATAVSLPSLPPPLTVSLSARPSLPSSTPPRSPSFVPAPAPVPIPLPPPRPVALPLLRTLYMDGTIYFLIVFSMRIFTGLVLAFASETLFYLSIFAEYALTSTAISRLFIHLRMVARSSDMCDEEEEEEEEEEETKRREQGHERTMENEPKDQDRSFVQRRNERWCIVEDEEMG
ncbi:hypothetical protein FRC14_004346, partial [Serendipita sp. 396]